MQIDFMPSQIIGGEHGLIAFIVIFGSGMLGLPIGKVLPERHGAQPAQAIVQTTMGTISLLAALVLGLLVATAKGKFDTVSTQVEQMAGNLMLLDHELRNYGPDTVEARGLLHGYVVARSERCGRDRPASAYCSMTRRASRCSKRSSKICEA